MLRCVSECTISCVILNLFFFFRLIHLPAKYRVENEDNGLKLDQRFRKTTTANADDEAKDTRRTKKKKNGKIDGEERKKAA